jgi:hypothetical protein
MATMVRAQVAHAPRNPFVAEPALEVFKDGALAFGDVFSGAGA